MVSSQKMLAAFSSAYHGYFFIIFIGRGEEKSKLGIPFVSHILHILLLWCTKLISFFKAH